MTTSYHTTKTQAENDLFQRGIQHYHISSYTTRIQYKNKFAIGILSYFYV